MKRYCNLSILVMTMFCTITTTAQNVGLGTTAPTERLHIHGGSTNSAVTRFTNNATGTTIGNGMSVGIQYQDGNTNNQYGYLGLQPGLPFYLWQANQARLQMDGEGYFGIRTKPINTFALAVGGPAVFMPGNGLPAFVSIADTLAGSGLPIGLALEKTSSVNGKHLLIIALNENKTQARIEANFFNGGAGTKVTEIIFDSTGKIGMGERIGNKQIRSSLHTFGDQRIESDRKYKLQLHSGANDLQSGSKIQFFYTPTQKLVADENNFSTGYFVGLNDGDESGDEARAFAIGKTNFPLFGDGEFAGFVHNMNNQVGIRRYPEAALTNSIKIDLLGNTRFTASKITINREANDPGTSNSIELRNDNVYRYGFGYDVANDRYFLYEGKSGSNVMLINNNRVGIAGRNPTTNALEVNGNASKSSAGDWLTNSDSRLKKNMKPISGAIEKIQQLQGITYQWNDDKTGTPRPTGNQMGFTAQNIQQVFPELVSSDAQGYLQTGYGTYDALYVEAIKELSKKIEQLEQKIKHLKEITQSR